MISSDLLNILVCPDDHSPLSVASTELVARLNAAISAGQVKNRGGELVKTVLDGGLIRADETLLYPVVDDIPMMLVDEAIPLDQLALAS